MTIYRNPRLFLLPVTWKNTSGFAAPKHVAFIQVLAVSWCFVWPFQAYEAKFIVIPVKGCKIVKFCEQNHSGEETTTQQEWIKPGCHLSASPVSRPKRTLAIRSPCAIQQTPMGQRISHASGFWITPLALMLQVFVDKQSFRWFSGCILRDLHAEWKADRQLVAIVRETHTVYLLHHGIQCWRQFVSSFSCLLWGLLKTHSKLSSSKTAQ